MNNNTKIGLRIKEIRKKRKLTQKETAEISGISRSYYGDIENGRYSASLETLQKIGSTLNVSTTYLLEGKRALEDMTESEINNAITKLGKQPAAQESSNINSMSFSDTMKSLEIDNDTSPNLPLLKLQYSKLSPNELKFIEKSINLAHLYSEKQGNILPLLEFISAISKQSNLASDEFEGKMQQILEILNNK